MFSKYIEAASLYPVIWKEYQDFYVLIGLEGRKRKMSWSIYYEYMS